MSNAFLQLPIPPGIGGSTLKNKKPILMTINATKGNNGHSASTLTVEPIPKASNTMGHFLEVDRCLPVIIKRKRDSTDKF